MRIYALTPTGYDRAKSFYGKANIIEENGEVILQSYDTFVCMINKRGAFVRLWGGYSATTMRHINVFIKMFGIEGGGKKWWDALPIEGSKPRAAELVNGERKMTFEIDRILSIRVIDRDENVIMEMTPFDANPITVENGNIIKKEEIQNGVYNKL